MARKSRKTHPEPRVPPLHDQPDEGTLPVPRLEIEWVATDMLWSRYTMQYRLVYRHFAGHLVYVPLGQVEIFSSSKDAPWNRGENITYPFREGVHAFHDAAHLRLPLYAVTDRGHLRIDSDSRYSSHRARGLQNRREP